MTESPSSAPSVAEIDAGSYAILNVLSCSPLFFWIDVNDVSIFLKERLPQHISQGVLNLQPLWDHLVQTPGIQKTALAAFFEELTRHELPWSLQLPMELQDSPSLKQNLSSLEEEEYFPEVEFLDSEDLSVAFDSDVYAPLSSSFDGQDIPSVLQTQTFSLSSVSEEIASSISVQSEDELIEVVYFEDLELDLDGDSIELVHDLPSEYTDSSLPSALSIVPGEWVQQHSDLSAQQIQEGVDLILGVLLSSPLALWINAGSFRQYMERRFPEYCTAEIVDLQPLWDNLNSIPGAQRAAVVGFFEELLRQRLPWHVCLPKALVEEVSVEASEAVPRSTFEAIQELWNTLHPQPVRDIRTAIDTQKLRPNTPAPPSKSKPTPSSASSPVTGLDCLDLDSLDFDDLDLGLGALDELDSVRVEGMDDLDFDEPQVFTSRRRQTSSSLHGKESEHPSSSFEDPRPSFLREQPPLVLALSALIVLLLVAILSLLPFVLRSKKKTSAPTVRNALQSGFLNAASKHKNAPKKKTKAAPADSDDSTDSDDALDTDSSDSSKKNQADDSDDSTDSRDDLE